jgi:leader peptidase (prepilin peptidase)/N-methyltransferase
VTSAELPWLLPAFAAVLGLVWGSFTNVVIHRLPLGESIVSPRSRCPGCRNLVASYDNIPVLSFIVLRGRCRHCAARISFRYPAIELAIGAASLLSFLRHGPSLEYVVEFAFVTATVALIFIDFDHQILPDTITLSGLVLGLALAWPREAITVVDALAGVALGGGLLFAVSELYFRVKKVEGMGFGDVKMMAMVGAFLGWRGVLLTLFLGSFTGSIVGLAVIGLSGGDMKTKLPFGTFLGMGAIATVYAGPPIITWYSALF